MGELAQGQDCHDRAAGPAVARARAAFLFVEQIPNRLTTITLEEAEYLDAIREFGVCTTSIFEYLAMMAYWNVSCSVM